MNNTSFVLVDFGNGVFDIEEIVYELRLKNLGLIIAHIERYRYVSIEDIHAIKKMGGIIQVNAKHLLNKGSKPSQKRALKLLKEDLIDIVASDIHNHDDAMDFVKAYQFVKKKKDQATADKLFDANPKKVLGIK